MSDRTATAGDRWTTDVVIVMASMVCAVVMWLWATQVSGLELEVGRGDETASVGVGAVVVAAGASTALGLGALRLLELRSRRALSTWTGLVVAAALTSMVGPLSATSAAARGTLIGMHAVVAVVVMVGAHRARRTTGRTQSAVTDRR